MAVLYIDLDLFKNVNDSFGHPVGDRLLKQVAERLNTAVRGGNLAARLGGDEFAVILAADVSPNEASDFARPADRHAECAAMISTASRS